MYSVVYILRMKLNITSHIIQPPVDQTGFPLSYIVHNPGTVNKLPTALNICAATSAKHSNASSNGTIGYHGTVNSMS